MYAAMNGVEVHKALSQIVRNNLILGLLIWDVVDSDGLEFQASSPLTFGPPATLGILPSAQHRPASYSLQLHHVQTAETRFRRAIPHVRWRVANPVKPDQIWTRCRLTDSRIGMTAKWRHLAKAVYPEPRYDADSIQMPR